MNSVGQSCVSYISQATPLLPSEQLYPTPSMQDNLSFEDDFDLRLIGCELIQTAGRLLKLPQTAMATGQILFHRYFYSKSFVKNNMEHYAMASIFLSSKIEEHPRRVRDVMNVFNHVKQVRGAKIIKPLSIDQSYNETKNQVIKAERRMLKELGFCVHVKHPHKIIFIYLNAMECAQHELVQKAWNYMNDCLRTDVFLRYTPETIACACIYLSARELQIPLPSEPAWFTIFGAREDNLRAISIRLLHLYSHKTKPQEELEKIVNNLRETQAQDRKKFFSDTLKESNKSDTLTPDSHTSSKNTPTFMSTQVPSQLLIERTATTTIATTTSTQFKSINYHGTQGYPYKEHQEELLAEYHEVLREVREKSRFNKVNQDSHANMRQQSHHTHKQIKKQKHRSRSRSRSHSKKHKKHHHHHHHRSRSSSSESDRSRSTSGRHKKKKHSHGSSASGSHHRKTSRSRHNKKSETLPVYM